MQLGGLLYSIIMHAFSRIEQKSKGRIALENMMILGGSALYLRTWEDTKKTKKWKIERYLCFFENDVIGSRLLIKKKSTCFFLDQRLFMRTTFIKPRC